jgi:hypothetical protein
LLPESAREAIRGNGMDFMRLQLRAAATAFGIFAVASLLLLLLVRGVGNIAAVLPFPRHLPSYSPAETLAALLDLRPLVAFGAGVLLAAAFVLIIRSQFLDRAVYMLVSMLTLILASSLGIAAGFAVYLFAVDRRIMVPEGIVPAALAFALLMVISAASLDALRRSLVLRTILMPILVIAAPVLLIYGS